MGIASIIDFVLLAAIWGSSFLFTRVAVVEFGVLPTAAVRVAVAALFLLPLLFWRGLGPQLRRHWRPVLIIGVLNSGIPFALFAFALCLGEGTWLRKQTALRGTYDDSGGSYAGRAERTRALRRQHA